MAFRRKNILLFLLSWRLTSVYLVQTSHVPDEYWQSLEVAHRLAFDYGYLTWEWHSRIRSYVYPFLISLLYRSLSIFHLDYTILLVNLPRIFQALLSGYADYRFYIWTRSKWALFSLSANWFWYYCASRTLTNSVETALTIVALSIYPWPDGSRKDSTFLWIVGFLTATRPTAAILWTPLCIYHLLNSPNFHTIKNYIKIGVVTLFYSILIDSLCYGTFVVTPWEFFRANVLQDLSGFYGTQHRFWYISEAAPVILGLHALIFPLAALGALRNSSSHRSQILMLVTILWTIAVYSSLAHKEFRFVLPILPLLLHVCTSCKNFLFTLRLTEFRRKIFLIVFTLSNLLPGLYFCLIHQRGSLDVMRILEGELRSNNGTESVMFLTPCHATPMYSHLHINVPIRFLTCEPNLNNSRNYIDEADEFFADPASWLDLNIENSLPDVLILFDNLLFRITKFLETYQLQAKIFHSHFPQSNYGEYFMIYKRVKSMV